MHFQYFRDPWRSYRNDLIKGSLVKTGYQSRILRIALVDFKGLLSILNVRVLNQGIAF